MKRTASIFALIVSIAGADAALAQAPAEKGDAEIVVTALRREQKVQDVPAAISVLDNAALRLKGAQDYRDYLNTIPGVVMAESGSRISRIQIRGVSDGFGATDQLTGIYIDEAPITETFQSTLDPDLYDVERVEVLKGPQGTLYGSGSMGGTVRVITHKPVLDHIEGSADGTISDLAHGGWTRRIDGMVNIPLVDDRLALRVSGGYRKDDGWIDDVRRNQKDGNTVEKKSARAQLLLKPADNTSIILGFLYQKEDLGIPFFEDFGFGEYQTSRAFRSTGGTDAKLYSLTINQDFGWAELISATNYTDKDTFHNGDSTNSLRRPVQALSGVTVGATDGIGVLSQTGTTLFTQEVRLASKGTNRIDWVGGLFYSRATVDSKTQFNFSQSPALSAVTTGPAFYDSNQQYSTRQFAAFGELTLNVTERLSLTAGLRAFDVEQRNVLADSGVFNGGSTIKLQNASKSSVTQKYLARFQATPNNLVYAQAAQGYRNGGPTGAGIPLAACGADLAAVGYTAAPTSYQPDKLWNYEIGSKNTLLGGRMTLNGAAYYIDWTRIQTSIQLACGFGFVANAGKAVSKGVELETSVTPVTGLTLTGNVSYNNAELKRGAAGAPGQPGDPLPLVPKWSWNGSAQYRYALSDRLDGFIRAEVNHVDSRWNLFRSIPTRAKLLDGYTTLNLRLGVSGEHWNAAVFATNLTDEHIVTYTPGTVYQVVGRPRTIGLSVGAKY